MRALRLASDMTQEDLAAHCGLFRTYMSRIETGQANPTLTMIHSLADSLGVHVRVLFDDPAEVGLARVKASRSAWAKAWARDQSMPFRVKFMARIVEQLSCNFNI